MIKKNYPARRKPREKKTSISAAVGHVRDAETTIRGLPVFNNRCFGCSPVNRHGLRLNFQENRDEVSVECTFRIAPRFEGPPGHVHGGIIATILDEAMGKVSRQKGVVALTRRMSIDYLQPVPLGVNLRAVGWHVSQDGRKHFHAGEIRSSNGDVLARSEGLFVAIDPVEMFRKYRKQSPNAGASGSVQRRGARTVRTAKLKS
ncbi:MAG: PaaI family thioesterase [Acidobacteriaceae bacterium]